MSTRTDIPRDGRFIEVADRCWVARHELADVNVGLVGGSRGLLVVDTHSSAGTARGVVDQVRALGAGEVVAVVNTHAHWDHVLGNQTFAETYDGAQLVAHEAAAAAIQEHAADLLEAAARQTDMVDTQVLAPDTTFASARVIDLGDRIVEVVHLGRGHTAGDAVVRVGDADVLYAGDLVEESGPPAYGDDCFPLDWPVTLDLVSGMLGGSSVVVPGHGVPVDRDFVIEQRASISVVAEIIRELAGRGASADQLADKADWPYPVEVLGNAFRRGVAHLPRGARGLPLA